MFPTSRMRRLRISQNIRDIVSETSISTDRMIMPVFLEEGLTGKREIKSMPGIYRHSIESAVSYLADLEGKGLKTVILFGIPSRKDAEGTSAYASDGIIQKGISQIKKKTGLTVIADLCLCEYTDHGHCGIVKDGYVQNDETILTYGKIAVSYARAGVDMVAPSGMMDGQVGAIREALDEDGFENISIMAYGAKYHTSLYGPFREAADSMPEFGDRKSYQMDYRNSREAIREMEEDLNEGADILMVKPAILYLDILAASRERFDVPLAAYNVSGEYSMIVGAIRSGLLGEDIIRESVTAIFRAGADLLITYFTDYLITGNLPF